jgi:hypothetical protein
MELSKIGLICGISYPNKEAATLDLGESGAPYLFFELELSQTGPRTFLKFTL